MLLNNTIDVSQNSHIYFDTPSSRTKKLPFYIQNYGFFESGKNYFTKRKELNNYLLIYTVSGKGFITDNKTETEISPNSIVIINCYDYHYYKTLSDSPWTFYFAHVQGTSIKSYMSYFNQESSYTYLENISNTTAAEFKNIIFQMMNKEPFYDIKIASSFTKIFTELILLQNQANNIKYFQFKHHTELALKFIHENYKNKICVDDIAKTISMSKYHFIRMFKSLMGITPYTYLQNYRINISKQLLRETNLSISQIVEEIGFSDVNNYIRYFKKNSEFTPLNYRKYFIN